MTTISKNAATWKKMTKIMKVKKVSHWFSQINVNIV